LNDRFPDLKADDLLALPLFSLKGGGRQRAREDRRLKSGAHPGDDADVLRVQQQAWLS